MKKAGRGSFYKGDEVILAVTYTLMVIELGVSALKLQGGFSVCGRRGTIIAYLRRLRADELHCSLHNL
jgi:hypothetical protein